MNFLDQPVFICGAPRSGTTLLISLLDGHSDLLAIPFEPIITEKYSHYSRLGDDALYDFFSRDYPFSFDVESILNEAYVHFRAKRSKERFGPNTKTVSLPDLDQKKAELFREEYLNVLTEAYGREGKLLLDAPHRALAKAYAALFPELEPRYFVQRRPMVNEVHALKLKRAFPAARFVHLLRDPRTRYLSAKKRRTYRSRLGLRFTRNIDDYDSASYRAAMSMTSFELARRNRQVLRDEYLILRYEDLVGEKESVLEKVCDFLGIAFEKSLLWQTRMLQQASPNSSFHQTSSQIAESAARRLDLFYEATSSVEQYIVHYFCARSANEFGYDLPVVERKRFLQTLTPIRHEHPLDYFKNRIGSFRRIGDNFVYILNQFHEDMVRSLEEGKLPRM